MKEMGDRKNEVYINEKVGIIFCYFGDYYNVFVFYLLGLFILIEVSLFSFFSV